MLSWGSLDFVRLSWGHSGFVVVAILFFGWSWFFWLSWGSVGCLGDL